MSAADTEREPSEQELLDRYLRHEGQASYAGLAMTVAALALVAIAGFSAIGTEPAHRARVEQAAASQAETRAASARAGYIARAPLRRDYPDFR